MSPEARRQVRVVNRDGLHARSCQAVVALVKKHRSDVRLVKGSNRAEGKSIFDLMLLEAANGDVIELVANGPDADVLVAALAALFASGFGEGAV